MGTEHVNGSYHAAIRAPRDDDQGYVASTWAHSLARGDRTRTRGEVRDLIDRVLDHPAVRLLVAHDPRSDERIIGWLAWTKASATVSVVHYVYVTARARRSGVASALLRAAGVDLTGSVVYTMRGPDAKALRRAFPRAIECAIEEFLG